MFLQKLQKVFALCVAVQLAEQKACSLAQIMGIIVEARKIVQRHGDDLFELRRIEQVILQLAKQLQRLSLQGRKPLLGPLGTVFGRKLRQRGRERLAGRDGARKKI